MDEETKKLIDENVQMKSLIGWLLNYAEHDKSCSAYENCKMFTFPNVAISMTEKELEEMEKMVDFKEDN